MVDCEVVDHGFVTRFDYSTPTGLRPPTFGTRTQYVAWNVRILTNSATAGFTMPERYGANSFANRNSFSVAYCSDFEVFGISRWHSCPAMSDFSLSFTP